MRPFTPNYAESGYRKRGFGDDFFTVVVWECANTGKLKRVELTHDNLREPHTLIFEPEKPARYFVVDLHERKFDPLRTPLLKVNGVVPKQRLLDEFAQRAQGVPGPIAQFIESELNKL